MKYNPVNKGEPYGPMKKHNFCKVAYRKPSMWSSSLVVQAVFSIDTANTVIALLAVVAF